MQQLGAGRQQQPRALGQLSLQLLTAPLSLPHEEAHGDVRELAAVQQLLSPALVTPCSHSDTVSSLRRAAETKP